MEENKLTKKWFWIVIGVCMAILLIVLLLYIRNFYEYEISKDTSAWGAFGDYVGGIMNPLLAIINIGVLVYLTLLVAKIDNNRANQEVKNQKAIALYSLKHDALKEFKDNLSIFQKEYSEGTEQSYLNILIYRAEFNSLIESYEYLFPNIRSEYYENLLEIMQQLSDLSLERNRADVDADFDDRLIDSLDKFLDLKRDFMKKLQNDILSE